ncbi:MAG: S9 family peptidase, partial [Acidobacteriota bacterium]
MKFKILLGCVVASIVTVFSARAEISPDPLTAEMLVDLRRVNSVALAPDGDLIAYTLEVPRSETDEPGGSYSELWLVRTADGEPRRFTSGKERVSSPAFSPDGKSVTFRVERKAVRKGVQLYAIPVDGGEARPLTEHAGSVSSFRWSPDGEWIAFTARDEDSKEVEEAKEAGKDWEVFDEDLKFRHLFLLEVASGETHRVFDADLDVNAIRWSRDGSTLLFQANETARVDDEYMNSKIYSVAAQTADGASSQPRVLTETLGKLGGMEVSPDGRWLAFLAAVSRNDPLAQSLFVVSAEGGEKKNLTEAYEGSVTNLAWQDDQTLLMLAVEGEQQAFHHVDPASGDRKKLPWPRLIASSLDVVGERWAVAAHSPQHPAEVFVAGVGKAPQRLSHHNPELDGIRLARQETTEWKGADDWTIGGVLTYPLDYEEGKRYPLVLQVHGGPEGVSLDGWTTRPGYPVQLLAARGFMVLEPNYRGSQGRGVAFTKADHDDLGGKEFDDILTGVDALIDRGMVDGKRVGTGGWSYGGYMSAWAATRWTDRFQASVVAAGLTNWISFAGTTDIPVEMSVVHWNSWWFDEPELHWQRSPMAHLNQAKTPTLVVTGSEDVRVHPEQAM